MEAAGCPGTRQQPTQHGSETSLPQLWHARPTVLVGVATTCQQSGNVISASRNQARRHPDWSGWVLAVLAFPLASIFHTDQTSGGYLVFGIVMDAGYMLLSALSISKRDARVHRQATGRKPLWIVFGARRCRAECFTGQSRQLPRLLLNSLAC